MEDYSIPSKEEQDMVERILECQHKSHYAVLGVQHWSTTEEIQRAYRTAALDVHPDKNRATAAKSAFQILVDARDVLIDEEKRRIYDESRIRPRAAPQQQYKNNTATEQQYYTPPQHAHRNPTWSFNDLTPSSNSSILIVLGILVGFGAIFIAALFGLTLASPIKYSLQPDETFTVRRKTRLLSISYYVTRHFIKLPDHVRAATDDTVEEDYISKLKDNCKSEQDRKDNSPGDWIFCTPRGKCGTREDMQAKSCEELKKHHNILSRYKRKRT